MRKRFKFPLLIIILLITSCSLIFVSYYLFFHQSYAMSVVADYPLSINYNTGDLIDKNNYEDVVFSVINNGDDDLLYTVNFMSVQSDNNLNYTLVTEDYSFEGSFETGNATDTILIKSGEIQYFTLNIDYNGSGNFEGEIYVFKEVSEDMKFYQTILSDSEEIYEEGSTQVAKEESTSSEGLITISSEDGSVYYFRGDITNNYVQFANYTWRIVKINSDGTVKLALDSELDVLEEFYIDEEYNFFSSNAYTELVSWYDTYLVYYDSVIENSLYCFDNSISNSEKNIFGAYNRIVNSLGATFDCIGSEEYIKIGLLTADEVAYAGATSLTDNTSFYLYSETAYYTMTSAVMEDDDYYPFVVEDGQLIYTEIGTNINALKPVITIVKNSYVTGSGTETDPYIIK